MRTRIACVLAWPDHNPCNLVSHLVVANSTGSSMIMRLPGTHAGLAARQEKVFDALGFAQGSEHVLQLDICDAMVATQWTGVPESGDCQASPCTIEIRVRFFTSIRAIDAADPTRAVTGLS